MKKFIVIALLLFISTIVSAQIYTIAESPNKGNFQINGVDYPQGHYGVRYSGDLSNPSGRYFSLFNIYDEKEVISTRSYTAVVGVTSWDELSVLFNDLGIVTSSLEAGSNATILPYELQVSQFLVPNTEVIDKFGINPLVETGGSEDIWEFGGIYNYDADGTAPILYLSSSNSLDTVTIIVAGLDINGSAVEQAVKLNGQTNVTLSTPLWRAFRLSNNSTVPVIGIVYCHTDAAPVAGVPAASNVRAIINDGNNQTLMSLYTIPKDKVGFLYRGEVGVAYEGGAAALAEFATIQYQSRRFGKVFTVKKEFSLIVGGTSIHTDKRSFPDIIPELTDIKITAVEVSANMGLWATFDIIIYDKSVLPASFITAIGMTP
jgi:hypothetical protein